MKHKFLKIFCTFCTASSMGMKPKRKTYLVEINANKSKENHSLGTVPTGQAENNGNGWMKSADYSRGTKSNKMCSPNIPLFRLMGKNYVSKVKSKDCVWHMASNYFACVNWLERFHAYSMSITVHFSFNRAI